jgi:hypothetical protein
MEGICKLCGAQGTLIHSHVLPAFLFKWLKQAGYIRHSQAPNRRAQDGAKEFWLCRKCEDIFNSFETPFATHIFHPYDRDRTIQVRYSDWLLKFCTSVTWRSLLLLKKESNLQEFSEHQKALAETALETWARYLRGEYKHTGNFEIHMLPFDVIEEHNATNLPPNINRYLTRAVEINAGSNSSTCFIYSKLGPFAIFGFIEMRYPNQWKGTKVSDRNGWFRPSNFTVPSELAEYISDRARRASKAMEGISQPQQQKIADGIRSNIDRFARSGLFQAMQRDVEMFGHEAFAKHRTADADNGKK